MVSHIRRSEGRPRRRLSLAVGATLVAIAGLGVVALPPRGEVPDDVRGRVLADLSLRTGRDVAAASGYYAVTELRSQAVVWPDGRLGCEHEPPAARSEPVSGYWLVLQIGATTYDYRIARDGQMVPCDPARTVDADAP